MIRAVIFDFGGVLMRTGDPAGRRAWEQRLHLATGTLERIVHGSPDWIAAQNGQLSPETYWLRVAEQLGIPASEIPALRADYFRDDRLDADLIALIGELRREGYAVGLLSNDATTLKAKLRDELRIYDEFDAVTISAQIGVMKPQLTAYQAAAKAVGFSSPECVFIDDNEANIDGAAQAGMKTIHYRAGMDVRATLAPLLKSEPTRALIFDFGNVLDIPDSWEALWVKRDALAARFGMTGRELQGCFYASDAWEQVKVGKITYDEYIDAILRPLGITDPKEQRAVVMAYYDGRERVHPDMLALLHELRPKYRLGLLSNAWQRDMETWLLETEPGLQGVFDVVVSSAAVGIAKPNPAIYRLTLERLQVAAGDAIFIDDLARNTTSAEATGLPCIVFESLPALRGALKRRGIVG